MFARVAYRALNPSLGFVSWVVATFQRRAIPVGKIGRAFICRLQKVKKSCVRGRRTSYDVIRQDEFAEIGTVERSIRLYRHFCESGRRLFMPAAGSSGSSFSPSGAGSTGESELAGVSRKALGAPVADLGHRRDEIVAALDFLVTGI